VELSAIVVAAAIAWPLSRQLQSYLSVQLERHSKYHLLDNFWSTLNRLAFPILWLSLQWVSIAIFGELEIRNQTQIVTTSLLTAWIIISFATIIVDDEFWSNLIAFSAWTVAALNILGLLDTVIEVLDNAAITLGQVTISLLMVIQGGIALGVLLWVATFTAHLAETRLRSSKSLSPSIQVLSIKVVHIVLGFLAFIIALSIVGVDLTALAVFGGAIGVGLGFGLQKIFANLVSGFILLLDKSIKPGDVIALPDYYGRVDSLGARYVSVTTRDGTEHLIPNEELITTRVENWSHSNQLLRLRQVVGVHYKSDIHHVMKLCVEAALETPRILHDPKPNCLLRGFGDSSVDFEMRFWIEDPMNGRANVTSDMLVRIWDKFKEHGIEIPYPQRDLHLRTSDIGKLND
jgi:small-conductance mechanosensitive channel